MNVKGLYRRVKDHHDGVSSFQLLCCKAFVAVDYHELDDWKFCPNCGHPVTGQLQCRTSDSPAWAWNRGIEDWVWPKSDPPLFWEIQSRYERPEEYDKQVSDLFEWTPDWNWATVVRCDNILKELRHHIATEADPMFWDEHYRLVYRDKHKIHQIYQTPWMTAHAQHAPSSD